MGKTIYLAEPRGFCAGVRHALETVENALNKYGAPIYVYHEIVHNDFVVSGLRKKGVVFVENLSDIPTGALVIFSAHGVSKDIESEAEQLGLKHIDATCPLVKKIHRKAVSFNKEGCFVFLIGHRTHPEVTGTLGYLDGNAAVIESELDIKNAQLPEADSGQTAYLTQTTLSIDDTADIVAALKKKYPHIKGSGDICYATQNRQNAVTLLSEKCDAVFVIGSAKSSNSNRLKEVARKLGVPAHLINSASEIKDCMLDGIENIGISAGASAPECLVEELIEFLRKKGWDSTVELKCAGERVRF